MKTKFKPKPFGIFLLGMGVAFIGALAKIMKEDFAESILTIALIVEAFGAFIFMKWYFKARKELRNNNFGIK